MAVFLMILRRSILLILILPEELIIIYNSSGINDPILWQERFLTYYGSPSTSLTCVEELFVSYFTEGSLPQRRATRSCFSDMVRALGTRRIDSQAGRT